MVDIGEQRGLGGDPGEPDADAAADPDGGDEKGEARRRGPKQHAPGGGGQSHDGHAAWICPRDEETCHRAQHGAAQPAQRDGERGDAARAAELREEGGEEDREDVGDAGDEEHAGEGEPEPGVRQSLAVGGHESGTVGAHY
jgi:hypothetical protein